MALGVVGSIPIILPKFAGLVAPAMERAQAEAEALSKRLESREIWAARLRPLTNWDVKWGKFSRRWTNWPAHQCEGARMTGFYSQLFPTGVSIERKTQAGLIG